MHGIMCFYDLYITVLFITGLEVCGLPFSLFLPSCVCTFPLPVSGFSGRQG